MRLPSQACYFLFGVDIEISNDYRAHSSNHLKLEEHMSTEKKLPVESTPNKPVNTPELAKLRKMVTKSEQQSAPRFDMRDELNSCGYGR